MTEEIWLSDEPQQDVAVLDFQISYFRPETTVLYLKSFFTNTKAVDENKDIRDDFMDRNESFQNPERRELPRPEKPCFHPVLG